MTKKRVVKLKESASKGFHPSFLLLVGIFLFLFYLLGTSLSGGLETVSGNFVTEQVQKGDEKPCSNDAGGVTQDARRFTNYCTDLGGNVKKSTSNYQRRYFCTGSAMESEVVECICQNGMCTDILHCTEDLKGSVYYQQSEDVLVKDDLCLSGTHLLDYYCRDSQVQKRTKICPLGCTQDGSFFRCQTASEDAGHASRGVGSPVRRVQPIDEPVRVTTLYPEEGVSTGSSSTFDQSVILVDGGVLEPSVLVVTPKTKVYWQNIDYEHYTLEIPGSADFKQEGDPATYAILLNLPRKSKDTSFVFKKEGVFFYQLKKLEKGVVSPIGQGKIVVKE